MRLLLNFFVLLLGLLPIQAEEDYPLGIEVVTGLRSDYVFRGFGLAGTTLDAQAESEVAFSDDLILTIGGWLASETSGEFSEVGGQLDLRKSLGSLYQVGASFTYQSRDMSRLDDGQDLSLYLRLFTNDDWDFKLLTSRDFESNGWYSSFETGWSHRVNDDSFLSVTSGISWVDAYYGRDGFNDFYGRLAYTYLINNSVSLTPFVGWSQLLDDDDLGGDHLFVGLWFEVIF